MVEECDDATQHEGVEKPAAPASLRLVLDTNAVLDWLLFRDKGFGPISAVIESGAARVFASEACLEELRRVLRYPEFGLEESRQAELLQRYRQCVCVVDVVENPMPADDADSSTLIPRCKDPDDQKFLELAARQAAVLVTRDKLLLQLSRRAEKGGRFRILRPDLLVQRYLQGVVAPAELPRWIRPK